MISSIKNTYHFLKILVCCLIISSCQTRATPMKSDHVNTNEIDTTPYSQKKDTEWNVHVLTDPITKMRNLSRQKRQLLSRLLPLKSRLIPRLSPLPRLPPRQPILLPLVTSAVSDSIRTYPYYFQEIPLAVGETIMESVREAAPHITGALKEISPGIMEMVNIVPNADKMSPLQQMVMKLPAMLHETVQVAMDPMNEDAEMEEEVPVRKMKTSLKSMDRTSNMKNKINWAWEDTKQKAQNRYQNLFDDYEDSYPRSKLPLTQTSYNPKKFIKKASSMSHTITPVLNDSLTEVAQIPKKIKKFIQDMKQ
ncbi:hypothetical protein O3G_MSEX001831 [Manduca sexta]|uniref:Lipoprotein n=1 Tax=Manduca sexta TaxID=7130 RepID=A0A922CD79_MANSE|nr:hypothetical protein O3G_MSEX001831 [Manduca sexta]